MSARHEEIFAAARRLPAAERESYLVEQCETEDERERVNLLLEKSTRADAFFGAIEEPPHVTEASVIEEIGDRIGPYTLVKELGDGGFGIVFEAEQTEPIARTVALKIIKQGMDTRQVIRRFATERQTLAMMEHPNIARVIDAGATATGRPYFAMELVEGEPITGFCKGHELNLRQRLDLFLDVCAAVSHAHQKGIIHRDLKPSNILVAAEGEKAVVKVIDFGIAKALEEQAGDGTLLTRAEQFIGTPLYVSPEQAASTSGAADTRSDVYSLGVILYELLTGSTPFDSAQLANKSHDEIRRIVREEDPPKPSTRLSKLPADLDWIVLKAIEKDRERRYESPVALAQDIRNHLNDQPVSAAAPGMSYRLGKLLKRHRTAFGAASVVLLALLAGLTISIASLIREKEAWKSETEQRRRAETSEKAASQISSILQRVLRSVDPAIAKGRDTSYLRDLLDQFAVEIDNELPVDSEEGIEIRLTIGTAYTALGELDKARGIIDAALAGAKTINDHPKTVEALLERARIEDKSNGGNGKLRKKLLEEANALSEHALTPAHRLSVLAKSRLGYFHITKTRGDQLAQEAADLALRSLEKDDPIAVIALGNLYQRNSDNLLKVEDNVALLRNMIARIGHLPEPQCSRHWARAHSELGLQLCRMTESTGDEGSLKEALDAAGIGAVELRKLLSRGDFRLRASRWILAMTQVANDDIKSARSTWKNALANQSGEDDTISRRLRVELAWMLQRRGEKGDATDLLTAFSDDGNVPRETKHAWVRTFRFYRQWDLATEELKRWIAEEEPHPDQSNELLALAALHLHLGNTSAFEETREQMVNRHMHQEGHAALERTAKAYFAIPVAPTAPLSGPALALAKRAHEEWPGNSNRALALGMAQYRMGNPDDAFASLGEANMGLWTNGNRNLREAPVALSQAFRAMAAHANGEEDLAVSLLNKCERLVSQFPDELHSSGWVDRILARFALEEAQKLIRDTQ